MSEDYNNKDNQLRVKSFEPNLVQIEIVDFPLPEKSALEKKHCFLDFLIL